MARHHTAQGRRGLSGMGEENGRLGLKALLADRCPRRPRYRSAHADHFSRRKRYAPKRRPSSSGPQEPVDRIVRRTKQQARLRFTVHQPLPRQELAHGVAAEHRLKEQSRLHRQRVAQF